MSQSRRRTPKRQRGAAATVTASRPIMSAPGICDRNASGAAGNPLRRWRLPLLILALGGLAMVAIGWALPTYWIMQAEQALATGRYSEAEATFQRLEAWPTRKVTALLGQARAARYSGDPSQARALLSIAESQGASPAQTQLERSLLQIQSGGSAAMIDQLSPMLVQFPEQGGEILEAYAMGFEATGTPQQAMSYIDQWIEGAPQDSRAILHKAELLATLGDTAAAETWFAAAMRSSTTLSRARRGWARVKLESGQNEAALALLDAAIAAEPRDIDLQLLRCSALLSLHREEEAIQSLRAVLALDESNFAARHSIASKLSERGKSEAAIAMIQPLMSEFPDDVSLNYLLASAYTATGNTVQADIYLQRHFEGRKQLDELSRLQREPNPAETEFERLMKLANGYLKYQWDEAEPWITKAIAAQPDSPVGFRAMASFQKKKGNSRRASDFTNAAQARER